MRNRMVCAVMATQSQLLARLLVSRWPIGRLNTENDCNHRRPVRCHGGVPETLHCAQSLDL